MHKGWVLEVFCFGCLPPPTVESPPRRTAAPLDAAHALGLEKKIGTVTAGKRADLVVVDGDPLADIKQIRKTVMVMRGGVFYRSDALYAAIGVKP